MQQLLFIAFGVMAFGAVGGATEATLQLQTADSGIALTSVEARDRIGQPVTVEGVVSGVHFAERTAFIDLDGRDPHEQIIGVIYSADPSALAYARALRGQHIAITGTVRLDRGRPEIVLNSANQIRAM
jgi:DNA/RNA endonuclease YhcR with UshA esterase domain